MEKTPNTNTVSSAAVRDLFDICEKIGALSNDRMQQLQIKKELFNKAEARIPESTLTTLWQLLGQSNVAPQIGLMLGQTIAPESKGLLASWVSQANTLREALTIFFKNIALMNPSESWQIEESQTNCRLIFSINSSRAYPSSAIERSMSAMVSWARALSGHPFPLTHAAFTFSAPRYAKLFTPIFGTHIEFDAKSNFLSFDKALLELPVLSSNQLLKTLIEEKATKVLSELSERATLSDKLKALIEDALSNSKTLSIQQASDALAVSRQTLYRQLKQERTDFQTIYDGARKNLAHKLLKLEDTSIGNVGLQLGFKDPSSFYKAFQRWEGMSPTQYRLLKRN